MKKRALICFMILSFSLAITSARAEPRKPTALEVQLTILEGKVKLTRSGLDGSRILAKSFPLYPKDRIETLTKCRAVLSYKDGTQMRMKPNTIVELQVNSLHVKKGKTWYKFTKRGSEFIISTPSLVAGIRGTEFDVAVSQTGKSMVSVLEGAVAVRGSKGEEVVVDDGFAVNCYVNSSPTSPYAFSKERKSAEWSDLEWMSPDQILIKGVSIHGEYHQQMEAIKKKHGYKSERYEFDPDYLEAKRKIDNRENDPFSKLKKKKE